MHNEITGTNSVRNGAGHVTGLSCVVRCVRRGFFDVLGGRKPPGWHLSHHIKRLRERWRRGKAEAPLRKLSTRHSDSNERPDEPIDVVRVRGRRLHVEDVALAVEVDRLRRDLGALRQVLLVAAQDQRDVAAVGPHFAVALQR